MNQKTKKLFDRRRQMRYEGSMVEHNNDNLLFSIPARPVVLHRSHTGPASFLATTWAIPCPGGRLQSAPHFPQAYRPAPGSGRTVPLQAALHGNGALSQCGRSVAGHLPGATFFALLAHLIILPVHGIRTSYPGAIWQGCPKRCGKHPFGNEARPKHAKGTFRAIFTPGALGDGKTQVLAMSATDNQRPKSLTVAPSGQYSPSA